MALASTTHGPAADGTEEPLPNGATTSVRAPRANIKPASDGVKREKGKAIRIATLPPPPLLLLRIPPHLTPSLPLSPSSLSEDWQEEGKIPQLPRPINPNLVGFAPESEPSGVPAARAS